jgi:SAM-dependent methyltransferase
MRGSRAGDGVEMDRAYAASLPGRVALTHSRYWEPNARVQDQGKTLYSPSAISANLLEDEGYRQIAQTAPRVIFCNSVLEHVLDPVDFANRCFDLLPPGGIMVITVPKSYPHHRDPIDTMFRPTPEEISALFTQEHEVLASEIIETGSYRDNLKRRPWIIYRQILRLPFPFLRWTKWKRSMKKFYWMIWPYRQSCVVIRKPVMSDAAD